MMLSSDLEGAMPLGAFLAGDGFAHALDRLAAAHGNADRRAAASFWSLYYFSALTIPYVVAGRMQAALPVGYDEMTIALAEDGLPRAFGLPHEGSWGDGGGLLGLVTPLVEGHLARVVELFKEKAGISAKLAWNNAAVYIDYAVNATEPTSNGEDHWPSRPLFDRPQLAGGRRNPFHGCLRREIEGGQAHCRRRVCCLRYMLPGIPSCGELCALPSQRKQ
ncbi:siderophore-iron reductase FhuF [Aminobacter sp. Piv2-1]|uniref:siderophore-iron reductase FhuF n=1 Tax=Aminobacter sp. Piv2-1 TaxID=3031122 RepID=UPI0030A3CF51